MRNIDENSVIRVCPTLKIQMYLCCEISPRNE